LFCIGLVLGDELDTSGCWYTGPLIHQAGRLPCGPPQPSALRYTIPNVIQQIVYDTLQWHTFGGCDTHQVNFIIHERELNARNPSVAPVPGMHVRRTVVVREKVYRRAGRLGYKNPTHCVG